MESTSKKPLPNYLHVFAKRVNDTKKRIKKELEKEKKERNRSSLKFMVREAKELQKAIKQAMYEHAKRCPNCGHVLES